MILQTKFLSFTFDYGTVGEETPIVDKHGTKLKVGDLVFIELKRDDGKTCIGLEPVVYKSSKCFVIGMEGSFNEDGNYDSNLEIEKVKNCEDINVNTVILVGQDIIMYVDEE